MSPHKLKTLICLVMCFLFISSITQLYAETRPASLVLEQSFGSDPYRKFASRNGVFLVTGTTENSNNSARKATNIIDILSYKNDAFQLENQIELTRLSSGAEAVGIVDVASVADLWLILLNTTNGLQLAAAIIDDSLELTIRSLISLDVAMYEPRIIIGAGNNAYILDGHPGKSLMVYHVQGDENGELEVISSGELAELADSVSGNFNEEFFRATFNNQALYVVFNQDSRPAIFYRLPVDENGSLLTATRLSFDNAQEHYVASVIQDDLWFLSYRQTGLQVLSIEGEQLSVVHDESVLNPITNILLDQHLVLTTNPNGILRVYDVDQQGALSFLREIETGGMDSRS